MKLPNAEAAFIDIRKLRDYSLNPDHDRGKHKARLFLATLGLDISPASLAATSGDKPMITIVAQLNLLDVVALKEDLPQHNLSAGQVGTIVETLAPDVYEVEFSDDDGQTYAMLPLHRQQLLQLKYQPANSTVG
jgi:Domain of unknown function (DUF4926)